MISAVRSQSCFYLVPLVSAFIASAAAAGPAVLSITSEPPGVTVKIRQAAHDQEFDDEKGLTPTEFIVTTVTNQEREFVLTLSLQGYHPAQRVVELSTNTRKLIHVVLTPSDQPAPEEAAREEGVEETESDATGLPRVIDREPEPEIEAITDDRLARTEVAFFRAGGLYVANADGSDEVRIASVGRSGARTAPAWSPDGSSLAFIEKGDLYVFEAGAPKRILRATDLNPSKNYWHQYTPRIESPVWRPDGSQVALLHYTRDGFANLYTVAPDGTGPTMVAELVDGGPVWHPSLPLIAVPQPGSVMIYDVRESPRGPAIAVLPSASEPRWSPDGAWLATASEGEVWICDAVGRGRRCVYSQEGYPARRPLWFVDSRRLVAVIEARKPMGSTWEEIWVCHVAPSLPPEPIADSNSQPGTLRTLDLAGLNRDDSGVIYGLGRNPATYYLQPLNGGDRSVLLQGAERPAWFWREAPAAEGSPIPTSE